MLSIQEVEALLGGSEEKRQDAGGQDVQAMLAEMAGLDPVERVAFFRETVIPEVKFLDPLDRDMVAAEAARLLKLAGVTRQAVRKMIRLAVSEPDAEIGESENGGEEKTTQADALISIGRRTSLFHDDQQEPFARFEVEGHAETWPVKSKFFRRWLKYQYFQERVKSPNSEAVSQALGVLEGLACFEGTEHRLSLRVAEKDGVFWYDLGDPKWRAVEVTPGGWQVVDRPPILFRRYRNTAAQVEPRREKDGIWRVLDFVNLRGTAEKYLLVVYLVACLVPGIPHPVPVFHGEKGAAKSTALRVLRRLVDPAAQELLTMPHDRNELALTLSTNYLPAFDNLDGLQPWQSDMLCCAVTGGGISKRELFTDSDEVILSFLRCPALNGINCAATRPDLLDRSIIFELERISPESRKEEAEFWRGFEEARPAIVGGMFDALSGAMGIYPEVRLTGLPRMADFCRWGYAAAEALGIGGEIFLRAYLENIGRANEEAITGNPVAAAVVALMQGLPYWEGTAGALLETLEKVAETEKINTRAKSWPKAANSLSRRLVQVKSNLLDAGIEIDSLHTRTGSKIIIRKVSENIVTTVTPSQTKEWHGFRRDGMRDDTEGTITETVTVSSLEKPRNGAACDDGDDSDGIFPVLPADEKNKNAHPLGVDADDIPF